MNRLFLSVLFAASAMSAEPSDPFGDPVTGFSDALVPILTSFERAKVQTTWRGFFVRADTQPRFQKSDTKPSEEGLYIDVEARGSEEAKKFSDNTQQEGGQTHRVVRIPAPRQGQGSLLIEVRYGRHVSPKAICAINTYINRIAALSKKPSKP